MRLPPDVCDGIRLGLEELHRHPRHDLNLGYRRLIWSTLGPRMGSDRCSDHSLGYRRRVILAIHTIRKVLPTWEQLLSNDDTPHRSLQLAEDVLMCRIPVEAAWAERNRLWTHCDNIANEHEDLQVIVGVGYGGLQALTAAIRDEQFDVHAIDFNLNDMQVDPEDLDASFFAAATYARGPVWDDDSDPGKRQNFWEWWLIDALQFAWDSAVHGAAWGQT